MRGLSPATKPVLPVTTAVAFASVGVATTSTDEVFGGSVTVWSSTTDVPFTVKTLSEVSLPFESALADDVCKGTRINSVAASMETSPRVREINKLKALPSQESKTI